MPVDDGERRPLLGVEPRSEQGVERPQSWARRNQWVVLALASGACAAFNGVFAKLYVFFLHEVSLLRNSRKLCGHGIR